MSLCEIRKQHEKLCVDDSNEKNDLCPQLQKDLQSAFSKLHQIIKSLRDDVDISIIDEKTTANNFPPGHQTKFTINFFFSDTPTVEKEKKSNKNSAKESKYEFIKLKHGAFKIIYNGEPIFLNKLNYDGLSYIQGIIRFGSDPNGIGIDSSKLKMIVTSNPELAIEDKAALFNKEVSQDNTPHLILDKKTFKRLRKRRNDITNELKHDKTDFEKNEMLEEEKMKIEKVLNQATDKKGRLRIPLTQSQKDYKAVKKTIDLVLDQLEKPYPKFHKHLVSVILPHNKKSSFEYKPSSEVDWILDE